MDSIIGLFIMEERHMGKRNQTPQLDMDCLYKKGRPATESPKRSATFAEARAKMIDAIGEKAAGRLMNAFAGRILYLSPRGKGKDAERIIEVIGQDAAERLFSVCGKMNVYFPKGSYIAVREWHKAIADAYGEQDLLEYARDCGISTVTLRKILKRFHKKTEKYEKRIYVVILMCYC
jgi:Mor family transcriptional regulator